MKKIFGFWIFLTIILSIESVKQIKQIYPWNRATEQQLQRGTESQLQRGT